MMKKILFSFLLACLCPLLALAQDVIVKKNGGTVVCRVVEVNKSEVIYKRWGNLQGSNYVMDLADVAAINYENGEKQRFDGTQTAQTPATVMPPKRQMGEMSDAELLNLAKMKEHKEKTKNIMSSDQAMQKAKRLKIAGWIVGPVMVVGGIAMVCASREYEGAYVYGEYFFEDEWIDPGLCAPGAILMAGGVATLTGCLVRAHNIKKKYTVQSSNIYGHDFQFRNGSSLSTNLCSLTDGRSLTPALGLGFNYNF